MRLPLGPADLPPGAMRGVEVGGRRVLLARVGDALHAIDDDCNHAGGTLSRGTLSGAVVACPMHGMTFDVRTGALTCTPRLCPDQRRYAVVVVDGQAFIEV